MAQYPQRLNFRLKYPFLQDATKAFLGMFWKKGQTASSRPPPTETRSVDKLEVLPSVEKPPAVADQTLEAVETLADVLRSLGKNAFDLDDLTSEDSAEEFEKWALRLLVGEVPSIDLEEGSPGSARKKGIRRDWGGVRRFVAKHRKIEHDYVVDGMANLRQAVRVFIQCTTGSFRAEREDDAAVSHQLDDLGKALAVNDHAQIRDSAEKTALTVRAQLDRRRQREQKQIEALRDSMMQLRHELSHAKQEAKTDGLTRVFNRAALDEHIEQVADQSFLSDTEACVIMLDIDHFKGVNDNYGHQAGDEVLRQIADTIVRGFFRREDFVSRYGGEEFCIVAQHTSFTTTRERAERLRKTVESLRVQAFGHELRVSVSFGIAALEKGESSKSWLKRADEALYRAKTKGRNRISIAPPGSGEALGRSGAPLGASLSKRPGENSPTIVRTRAQSSEVTPGAKHAPANSNGDSTTKRSSGGAVSSQRRRSVAPTSRSGARSKKESPGANSPIAALLGPSSRR